MDTSQRAARCFGDSSWQGVTKLLFTQTPSFWESSPTKKIAPKIRKYFSNSLKKLLFSQIVKKRASSRWITELIRYQMFLQVVCFTEWHVLWTTAQRLYRQIAHQRQRWYASNASAATAVLAWCQGAHSLCMRRRLKAASLHVCMLALLLWIPTSMQYRIWPTNVDAVQNLTVIFGFWWHSTSWHDSRQLCTRNDLGILQNRT